MCCHFVKKNILFFIHHKFCGWTSTCLTIPLLSDGLTSKLNCFSVLLLIVHFVCC
jgi:hypothetical protein